MTSSQPVFGIIFSDGRRWFEGGKLRERSTSIVFCVEMWMHGGGLMRPQLPD